MNHLQIFNPSILHRLMALVGCTALLALGLFSHLPSIGAMMSSADTSVPPYLDESLSFEERAADLVSRMTLEEKASQMGDSAAAIPRLGVPAYKYWSEGIHGVARSGEATSFPYSLGIAASWDAELMQATAAATADEARGYANGKGKGLSYWSPTINLARDPRWGRSIESFSEDPYLTAVIGSAFVKGFQGDDPKYLKVIATLKHYAANNSEFNRHNGSADIDDRTIREYYTKAFRSIIQDANVASVMTAYNAINGTPMSANRYMLDTLLRKTFGFTGYTVSDCGAIDNIFKETDHHWKPKATDYDFPIRPYTDNKGYVTAQGATALSIMAGTDLNCGGTYQQNIVQAVKRGLLSENDLDVALLRLFTARMKTGEFDPAEKVPYRSEAYSFENQVENAEHKQLAEDAADESIVLLKNEPAAGETSPILPLDPSDKNIVVVGRLANMNILGDYSGTPSSQNLSTPLQGIAEVLGYSRNNTSKITYISGSGSSSASICNLRDIYLRLADGSNKQKLTPTDAGSFRGVVLQNNYNFGYIEDGAYVIYKNINIDNVTKIALEISGTGANKATVEVRVGSPDGYLLASVNPKNTTGWTDYQENETSFTIGGGYTGVQDLCVVFKGEQKPFSFSSADEQKIRNANTVIACIGSDTSDAGEGRDRGTLTVKRDEDKMVARLLKLNPRTVVYIQSVGVLNIEAFRQQAPAILWCCYNGQAQGNAMARVIFGQHNPTAKLPFTWYSNENELPPIEDYTIRGDGENHRGRTYQYFSGSVAFPFGYGLSYTQYAVSNIQIIKPSTVTPLSTITVKADVKNLGNMAGAQVLQVYVSSPLADGIQRPFKELKGYTKVKLAPQQTKTVTLEIPVSEMYFWDEKAQKNVFDTGNYTIRVATSSADSDVLAIDTFSIQNNNELGRIIQTVTLDPGRVCTTLNQTVRPELTVVMKDDTFFNVQNAQVAYSSNRPEVARVTDDGTVIPVSAGVATITAKVTIDGNTKESSFPLVVLDTVGLSDIYLDGESLAGFQTTQTSYKISLEKNELPVVTVPESDVVDAEVTITPAASIPGTTTITLKKGEHTITYTLEFVYYADKTYLVTTFPMTDRGAVDGVYTVRPASGANLALEWTAPAGGMVDLSGHDPTKLYLRFDIRLENTDGKDPAIDKIRNSYLALRDVNNKEISYNGNALNVSPFVGANAGQWASMSIAFTAQPDGQRGFREAPAGYDFSKIKGLRFFLYGAEGYAYELQIRNLRIVDITLEEKLALLEEALDETIDESLYTPDSVAKYNQARSAASAVLEKGLDATVEEVEEVLRNLNQARAKLRPVSDTGSVDKSELEAELDKRPVSGDAYTKASWEAYVEVWNAANEVYEDEEATQEEVDEVLEALIEAYQALVPRQMGDVNGDEAINATDARLTLQAAVKKITFTDELNAVADVNGDGNVNATDARLILQYAVKKITQFPAQEKA